MKTDTIFYRLFQSFPSIFFELIQLPATEANNYSFDSVEVKQLSFRIDGIFLPQNNNPHVPIYFCEVQFQKDNDFYGYMRLLSNEKGEYNFHTILPGGYKVSKDLTRTPHIHFKVASKQKQLTTQMYFKGNKMNKKDFLFKNTYNNNALEASIDKSFSNLTYKFDIII